MEAEIEKIKKLKTDIRKLKEAIKPKVECGMCKKEFKNEYRMKTHSIMVHRNRDRTNELQCRMCNRICKNQKQLTKHTAKHSFIKCNLCMKRFSNVEKLEQHRRNHTEEKRYACKYCNLRFHEASDCEKHEHGHSSRTP